MSLSAVDRKLDTFRKDVSRTRRAVGSLTVIALCAPVLAAGAGAGVPPRELPAWLLPAVAGALMAASVVAAVGEEQLRRTLRNNSGVLALCERLHGTGNDQAVTRRLSERSLGRVNFRAPAGHLAAVRARRREAWATLAVGVIGSASGVACATVLGLADPPWVAVACVPLVIWRGFQVALGVRELRVYTLLESDILRKLGLCR